MIFMYDFNACRTRVYEKSHVMLVRARTSFYLFLPGNAACQDVKKNLSILCSAPQVVSAILAKPKFDQIIGRAPLHHLLCIEQRMSEDDIES